MTGINGYLICGFTCEYRSLIAAFHTLEEARAALPTGDFVGGSAVPLSDYDELEIFDLSTMQIVEEYAFQAAEGVQLNHVIRLVKLDRPIAATGGLAILRATAEALRVENSEVHNALAAARSGAKT